MNQIINRTKKCNKLYHTNIVLSFIPARSMGTGGLPANVRPLDAPEHQPPFTHKGTCSVHLTQFHVGWSGWGGNSEADGLHVDGGVPHIHLGGLVGQKEQVHNCVCSYRSASNPSKPLLNYAKTKNLKNKCCCSSVHQ